MQQREFYIVISKDADGGLTGEAPQLRNCINQGQTTDELLRNMRETIQRCLKDDDLDIGYAFIGFHKIEAPTGTCRQGNAAKTREFYIIIEQDENDSLIGQVSGLKGAYSYGRSFDELMVNMRDVIGLCLEDEEVELDDLSEFVGVQKISIPA